MSSLIERATYVQQQALDGDVVSATMYMRRHVFKTSGGHYFVERAIAGVEKFASLYDATVAINGDPRKYPTFDGK